MGLSLVQMIAILLVGAVLDQDLEPADQSAAFAAAGFSRTAGQWRACDAPPDSPYTPGTIETVRDFNNDGRPEAIITEGSSFCYGHTEVGFFLVGKQPNGDWKLILASPGIARVLPTTGIGHWPDIEISGPGFCFPIRRWDGKAYEIDRFEYDNEVCQPG